MSCGNQSTYNRVANAGNLHRLSPFQMPFGILHNLTGKSSLTFSIEKCHFITANDNELADMVYVLGFGWIESQGPNQVEYAEDMYENGNKIGIMG